ncbi:hypothetical protein COOONC_01889 [Cooperia oncophora]
MRNSRPSSFVPFLNFIYRRSLSLHIYSRSIHFFRFKSKNPEDPNEVPNGFLSDVNKDSLTVLHNVLIDRSIANSKVYDRFQFERVGYFCVDQDTVPGKVSNACESVFPLQPAIFSALPRDVLHILLWLIIQYLLCRRQFRVIKRIS